jgi:multidrug resistance efflux pump
MKSGVILLGIVLLLATLFGAKMVFYHDAAANDKNKIEADANKPPEKVLCWGYFDVDVGVAKINPRQFGKITYVARENTSVKKGEPLLRVDKKLAELKVDEAQADVNAGIQQVALANQLTRLYELQREEQQAAVNALGLEKKKLEAKRDSELLLLANDKPRHDKVVELYEFALDQLAEKKKAEVAKLEQVKLQNADLKIFQAKADLEAKNVRLNQAKELRNQFEEPAPSDGIVLRVYVHEGETLGPIPMNTPALEFLPKGETIVKAEVLQEWGRFIDEKKHQEVEIEDDTYHGPSWKGTVKSVSKWYAPPRSTVIEPFRLNDVRTLEVIISVEGATGMRNGQRVRAKIKIQ